MSNKNNNRKRKNRIGRVFKGACMFVLAAALLVLVGLTGINIYVKQKVNSNFLTAEQAEELEPVDCIIVLGASVRDGDTPSPMLRDRLDRAIELYKAGCAPKILMSGDHGSEYYNEVGVMKKYAMDAGVPSEDIFLDHAGFSTYESMYRAKAIFGAKRVLVVTQQYHLTRALYDAKGFGIEAYGVAAKPIKYGGQLPRDIREYLAIGKDFVITFLKPEPTVLGNAISLEGNGDITDDEGPSNSTK